MSDAPEKIWLVTYPDAENWDGATWVDWEYGGDEPHKKAEYHRAPEWVSVEERLPESKVENGRELSVLCYKNFSADPDWPGHDVFVSNWEYARNNPDKYSHWKYIYEPLPPSPSE